MLLDEVVVVGEKDVEAGMDELSIREPVRLL